MGGLARLSGGRIDGFTQLDSGLANDVVYGVAASENEVWAATAAGLSRYDTRNDLWEIFDTTNTLMHEPWCYAVTAHGGAVYVAVWGGGVIVREQNQQRFREHRDPDGEMEIDLFRDDGLVHDVTSTVAVDEGVMWVGTYFGLSRYDGRHWRSYNQEDSGLAGDFINFLKASGEVVWIATDQGFSRFDSVTWQTWRRRGTDSEFELVFSGPDGRAAAPRPAVDSPGNVVFGIDVQGEDVWLATSAGLIHGVARERPGSHPTSSRGRRQEE
jgi:ligand-binding sensor domain-containing protein